MKRRNFIKYSIAATMANGIHSAYSNSKTNPRELDKYGGWKGKKFTATGFFRAEKEDRWWLVTPEGNAFISLGINHFTSYFFQQQYNIEAWKKNLGVNDIGPEFNKALRSQFLSVCQDFGFITAGCHTQNDLLNDRAPTIAYIQPIKFIDIPHWKSDISDDKLLDVFSYYVCRTVR